MSAGRPAFTLNDWTGRIESDLARVSADDLPDFFVLSPPRTGTTWVANVLAAHDEIYIPPEKELRYFDVGWQCSAIDFYLSRFRPGRGRVKGDASPSYVLLPIEVIRLLRQAKPTLKFIIVVRDLAERAWSNFNHSFAVGELGLAGKRWAQDKVAVEHTLDYLVSDYSVMVGDYAAYLTRWLQCFPPEQFFVFRLDQDDAEKEALLRHLHQFLGVGTSVRGADALYRKINAGYRTGSVARDVHQLLRALYTARQPQQDRFLHETFGVSLPEPAASEGDAQPLVELLNRADGYKVFVWRGCFYASFLEDFPRVEQALVNGRTPPDTCLAAHTYSDLIASIEAQKCGIEGPPVQRESQRLLHVLQRLAEDYARTNQLHVNLGTLRLLHEHAGFNLLAFGGQVIALRQLLGPVDLTGSDAEQLVARYGSDNVVVGRSVDEVVERIDSPATSNDAPERVAENIAAPVRDAADDRSHLIDGPFLDCNLVGYRARVYAIPRALGRVRLDTLPPGKLALLPSASSVSELQALLSVGGAVLARRLDAMRALAAAFDGEPGASAGDPYWQVGQTPNLIGVHHGFNLFSCRGAYLGLRQTLGAVDPSGDWRELVGQFSTQDVIVNASLEQLCIEVDGLASSQRVAHAARAAQEHAQAGIGALEARVGKVVEAFEEMTIRVGQLQARQVEQEVRLRQSESGWMKRLARTMTRVIGGIL